MMTGAQWTRGTAKVWGGNWGLRDANLSLQHEAYSALASPTGGSRRTGLSLQERDKLLQPLPEPRNRGNLAIEAELQKIFKAYARPTNLFPSSNVSTGDGVGKDDWYADKKIGELILGTNLAQKEKFESLDDNGYVHDDLAKKNFFSLPRPHRNFLLTLSISRRNGKLSWSELKMGMRNMGNVWLSIARVKCFLGSRADEDLSYEGFISIVKNRIAERYVEAYRHEHEAEIAEFPVSIGHLGFRRFVADCLRFEREGVDIPSLDRAFLLGVGYETALPHLLEFVREDNPVDTNMPVFLSYRGFRHGLLKHLGAALMPTPPPEYTEDPESYDPERTFIRHVVLPNAKRPVSETAHPLYSNFYQEDVLNLLHTYRPMLQFIFAHYATLECFYAAKSKDKMAPENFPGSWGAGNGMLRMKRSEFEVFCDNFGIIGSRCVFHGQDPLGRLVEFSRMTANWVFTSAKNGPEADEMCAECR